MKKIITIPLACIGIIMLLLDGKCRCAELLDWMHSLSKDNIEAYFCSDYMNVEQSLHRRC